SDVFSSDLYDPCDRLPLSLGGDPGLFGVYLKAHPEEKRGCFMDHSTGIETAGKGQVIAVSGIGDFSGPAPVLHIPVKGKHDQIGNIRGRGSALGEKISVAAQMGKKGPERRGKQFYGESMLIYTDESNIREEIRGI